MRTPLLPLPAISRSRTTMAGVLCALAGLAIAPVMARAEAAGAPPVGGGQIGTLEPGTYGCETPGDATGNAGKPYPQLGFQIINSSSYRSKGQRGSYLLTGRTMIMTDGPLRGTRFQHVSRNRLQLLDEAGRAGEVRCVRAGPAS